MNGGTISEATGGKFANGAMTAAIQWALNSESKKWIKSKRVNKVMFSVLEEHFHGSNRITDADYESFSTAGHGNNDQVALGDAYTGLKMDEVQYLDYISKLGYVKGKNIELFHCYVGAEGGFAQKLSAINGGGIVKAVDGLWAVDSYGNQKTIDGGKWVYYQNGERLK